VLDVATRLFAEFGFERTTVRMISDELGIKSGSLFSHIDTKDELLRDVVARVANRFFYRAEAAMAEPGTAEERLRALGRAHMTVLRDDADQVRVYYDNWRKLDGPYYREIVSLRRRYEEMFAIVVSEGVDSGEFKPVDVRSAMMVVLSVLNWVQQWYSVEGRLQAEKVADSLLDVVLGGLIQKG
jgi:AcrR family transcriptional regulator